MATLFFSYSHKDEDLRNQLEVHPAALKRQGLLSTWHDRRILPGTEFDQAIDENINKADIILLLISPDFIDSDYCYKQEMTRSLERHNTGVARVIPVILRRCDWHDLPFGKLLATPRDGKPIKAWPDIDEAFHDVVTAIKAALQCLGRKSTMQNPAALSPTGSIFGEPVIRAGDIRPRRRFSDLDKDRFRH